MKVVYLCLVDSYDPWGETTTVLKCFDSIEKAKEYLAMMEIEKEYYYYEDCFYIQKIEVE